jgi:hypothetical protein
MNRDLEKDAQKLIRAPLTEKDVVDESFLREALKALR